MAEALRGVRTCPDQRGAILDFPGSVYGAAISLGRCDAAAHEYIRPAAPRRGSATWKERQMPECQHMKMVPVPEPEASGAGCKECLEIGQDWVKLRKCLECGHIGCCDSSIGKHATQHAHETGHNVIRSFEPGEGWRYCYADETYSE